MRNPSIRQKIIILAVILAIAILLPVTVSGGTGEEKPAQPEILPPPKVSADVPEPEPDVITMIVEATAYTHTGYRTATMTWPKVGTIAVDPKVIPMGSIIDVPGYGVGIAEDTGGLIKGEIIDLFMETEKEAIQWGRRLVKIRVIYPDKKSTEPVTTTQCQKQEAGYNPTTTN